MRQGNRAISVPYLIASSLLTLLVTCSFVKPRFNTVIEIAPASAIRVFDYAESLPITRNAHLAPPTTLRIILIRVLGGFYRASPLHVHWIFTRQSLASFDTRVIARPTTCVVRTSSTHDKGAARSSWTRPRVFLVVVYASAKVNKLPRPLVPSLSFSRAISPRFRSWRGLMLAVQTTESFLDMGLIPGQDSRGNLEARKPSSPSIRTPPGLSSQFIACFTLRHGILLGLNS